MYMLDDTQGHRKTLYDTQGHRKTLYGTNGQFRDEM
jgi:hypothetical protein